MFWTLSRFIGRKLAILLTAGWYAVLILAVFYFSFIDQAPFRYGQL